MYIAKVKHLSDFFQIFLFYFNWIEQLQNYKLKEILQMNYLRRYLSSEIIILSLITLSDVFYPIVSCVGWQTRECLSFLSSAPVRQNSGEGFTVSRILGPGTPGFSLRLRHSPHSPLRSRREWRQAISKRILKIIEDFYLCYLNNQGTSIQNLYVAVF